MALFGFGKKKDEPLPKMNGQAPVGSINPDDFFRDMGRKPKKPKGVEEISSPEIVGLHDEPLPRPKIDIKSFGEIDTTGLADKTEEQPTYKKGNIKQIDTESLDTEHIGKEEKILRSAPKPVTADDFFKDLDRKRPKSIDIDLPEITGLREEPIPHHNTDIGDEVPDETAVDALPDKLHETHDYINGDISTIDVTKLDMSGLRDE